MISMTREYFESHSFNDVIEMSYEENTEVTTLNMLKDFVEFETDKGNYYLAKHVIDELAKGNDQDYWLYDYSMGTLDTPVPIDCKEDVEHLIDD